ncbi:ABC transporter ATP-binding protein/permease [Streptomyces sp. NBC_00053]|uniref:ABC transporter transmembrane domain-containing protein n=1 Tax=unclassified Streptomyces TaxID=2593676 RepID=UPI00224CD959|nr:MULTISPECIES: ABC transporter ATP-binding protein [unclassified Streptomyces]WSG53465.1 ABC transporter ATP-binding protein/permease [Streptomyces sp. NBC_01732]WSX04118.1 ABC transporter ATP-binding protein/permease [Streptomyces sp. NBC_00987]MCX5163088.1 ABC transporter ATP-binding protein/permease [Streptomyces sp. NBC_00305]MCX5221605.1 ABC transporter ATP-binding protein/permease [Streptomyces sp. NBC_00264]MCX5503306.1 ABC transporter ATP-binding protein/permease [Streptomyces sp. NB
MVCLTLPPYLLSRAIDDGLQPGRWPVLAGWVAALLGVGVLNAWLAIMRHRTMTRVRLDAAFRSVRAVVAQATRLGGALPRRVTAGEVVTIGFGDVGVIAGTLTITGPGVGAVLAFVVVAALLLAVEPLLAAVVLLGVPLLAVLVGPLLGRLQGVETAYRERQGELAGRFADMAGGLRVLNGIGGKEVYAERYRRGSQELRAQGYRVGAVTSWIQALGVGLPTLFLGVVTWLAARMAAQGTISIGELVAVYGYAAVLVVPVSFFIEGGYGLSRGLVAARRVIRFLVLEPDSAGGDADGSAPAEPSVLRDPASGVEVVPGRLTALAGARPSESAAVVERLGRFTGSAATWGGIRIDEIDLTQVRRRILVADNEADLFAGPLREVIGSARDRDEESIGRALYAAVAQDIVRGLPDGLDSPVDAQGRNLSGGQRQRVRLVRALLADPEVLLAVEPTSAVDAHTEAAMAARLRAARSGRTTVVTTASPLLLDRADTVYYLVDGRVAAVGSHRELLDREPGYRLLVSRGADDDPGGEETVPPSREAVR